MVLKLVLYAKTYERVARPYGSKKFGGTGYITGIVQTHRETDGYDKTISFSAC